MSSIEQEKKTILDRIAALLSKADLMDEAMRTKLFDSVLKEYVTICLTNHYEKAA